MRPQRIAAKKKKACRAVGKIQKALPVSLLGKFDLLDAKVLLNVWGTKGRGAKN